MSSSQTQELTEVKHLARLNGGREGERVGVQRERSGRYRPNRDKAKDGGGEEEEEIY